ncbi:MAG: DoxX family protein [Candidatus Sumerlaeia bacterium]|nr:DoxX family protein [Candidatus Sumerlaeia bacterium]
MTAFFASLTEEQTPLVVLLVLRLSLGGLLVWEGYQKVQQGYIPSRKQETQSKTVPLDLILRVWMDEQRKVYGTGDQEPRTVQMFPWYRAFLEHAVLPNVALYATLVAVGELALGAVLILGVLVPWVSGLGILLGINYLIATWHLGFPYTMLNILFITSLLVLALSRAGRCLGFDGWIHKFYPEIPIF